MRIKAILFDLFHTLVDVGSAPGATGRYTADILGVDRSAWRAACFSDLHELCRSTDHSDIIRRLAHSIDPTVSELRIEQATLERQRRFDHALRCVDRGTVVALRELRHSGFLLGLVSNASTGEVCGWPDSPLSGLFDAAVFSCECGSRKPEPGIYEQALGRVGVEAAEAVFVGDGGSDEHAGARRVGLTTVLTTRFLTPETAEQRRGTADWEIAGLRELPPLLRRIATAPTPQHAAGN